MKKIALLLLAAAMIVTLAVSASAYFEAEEAFGEVKFEISKQTTAWNPDGTITDGEYYKVDIKPEWLSYAINDNDTDAGLAYAKATTPELYMSWDETYVYAATRYTVTEGHENLWDGDPASMWYSGAVQFNYANFDEVASEYRLEYGVGLSSDTGDTLYTVWADGVGNGYEPTQDDAKVWLNGNTLTYETRVPWEAFADEDNTGYKEGNGFNTTFVWSIGKGQDYVHIQLAEGCTGNGKHAENMAQVTLAAAPAGAAPAASGDGVVIYSENFDSVSSVDDLGWKFIEDYKPKTADFAIENGKLAINNLDADHGGADSTGDTYFEILPSEVMEQYKEDDYTIAYTLTYEEAEASSRYVCLVYNYDEFNVYNSMAVRVRGNGDNECCIDGTWIDYDTGSDLTMNATDENSVVSLLLGLDYDGDAMPLLGYEMNIVIKCSYDDGPSVYINGVQFSSPSDLNAWNTFEKYAVALKVSPKVKATIDNIVIYKGLGDVPSASSESAAQEPAAAPTYTYPASGAGDNIITGTVIGNETGWGGSETAGRDAAFDGNPATFFDPLGVGDGFCGIDAGESYILDKVAILSRDGWAERFEGAMIQGSNDGENWTTLWTSPAAAESTTEYKIITDFENNTGYSQFRYFNEAKHGDVAEVEFYGAPGKVEVSPVEETEPSSAEQVDEKLDQKAEAPNTFDFGVVAAVAAVISLGGFAVAKKRK